MWFRLDDSLRYGMWHRPWKSCRFCGSVSPNMISASTWMLHIFCYFWYCCMWVFQHFLNLIFLGVSCISIVTLYLKLSFYIDWRQYKNALELFDSSSFVFHSSYLKLLNCYTHIQYLKTNQVHVEGPHGSTAWPSTSEWDLLLQNVTLISMPMVYLFYLHGMQFCLSLEKYTFVRQHAVQILFNKTQLHVWIRSELNIRYRPTYMYGVHSY